MPLQPVEARLVEVVRRPGEVRTPGPRLASPGRILVAREDKLGDFVLALPAIERIAATYPGAALVLLVDERVAPLARAVPGVEQVVACSRDASPAWLAARLREAAPDVLISISRRARATLAARLAGIPVRGGPGGRIWSPLLTRRVVERRSEGGRHEVEYSLSFAHRVGAEPADASFPLRLPDEARERVGAWRHRHGVGASYVVLHPGSGGSCPAWPIEHYAELCTLLRAAGIEPVVSIGPEDGALAATFAGRTACFSEGLTALAALLEGAALAISNSTGPIHVAAALGAPALALHAPWTSCGAARWAPYGARGRALVAVAPGAERWSRGKRRRLGGALLAAIAPQTVLVHAQAML